MDCSGRVVNGAPLGKIVIFGYLVNVIRRPLCRDCSHGLAKRDSRYGTTKRLASFVRKYVCSNYIIARKVQMCALLYFCNDTNIITKGLPKGSILGGNSERTAITELNC